VLTMGPVGDLKDGAVAFAGGEVLAVGPYAEVAGHFADAAVVGADRGIVLPGLVDAHTHLSEALIPGMGENLTLLECRPPAGGGRNRRQVRGYDP
jgi:5-methylthioadenosine/S-adenosylhomocysteine deaminase